MTTRPRLYRGSKLHGLLALALFAVLAGVFLAAEFGTARGFANVESITAAIGYAMFDIDADVVPEGTEGFLVAFIVVAVVLDAALDAAVMLARREEDMGLPYTDGGSPAGEDDPGDDSAAEDRQGVAGDGAAERTDRGVERRDADRADGGPEGQH